MRNYSKRSKRNYEEYSKGRKKNRRVKGGGRTIWPKSFKKISGGEKIKKRKAKRKFRGFMLKFGSIFLALVIFVGLYFIFFKLSVFEIRGVKVSGTKIFVNKVDLENLAESRVLGKNIFTLNKSKIEQSLEKDFQGAKEIQIKRSFFPPLLQVDVEERVAFVLVKDREGFYFVVDKEGYVLGEVSPETTNLPQVNYYKELSVGRVLDSKLISTFLELINALDKQKIVVSNLQLRQDYLYFETEGIEILVSTNKNKDIVANTLRNLLTKLSAQGKNASRIDLRYDKVVVSYRN